MSFNKKYVSDLDKLKEELEKYPDNLNYYMNADSLIGPTESLDYIYMLWNRRENENLKNSKEDMPH